MLDRYYIKLKLGVDLLDEQILDNYHYKYQRIFNCIALRDQDNIPKAYDNQHDDLRFKLPIVKELIHGLGFKDVFDTNKRYNRTEFTANINNLINKNIFTHDATCYKVFDC